MIVCLEGASAVGKTSTCRLLAAQMGAHVIPEVNALFTRPENAGSDWYLERQADRWAAARQASEAGQLAVLDGDPFQPLWYNWSFDFQNTQSLDALRDFYRPRIAQGLLQFPDVYVHLVMDQDELRRRKESDHTRSRRNFESHLRLLETMPQYFAVMGALAPGLVYTVNAVSLESNFREVVRILEMQNDQSIEGLALFDDLADWLADSCR